MDLKHRQPGAALCGFRSSMIVFVTILVGSTLLFTELIQLYMPENTVQPCYQLMSSHNAFQNTTLGESTAVNWQYRPWNCFEKREEMRVSGTDPNKVSLNARLVTDVPGVPPFYMSLSTKYYDPNRWSIMKDGIYYEKSVTNAFVKILNDVTVRHAGKDVRVIDVGSNQGWFSLLSAAMGYPVDAFDANPVNSLRICESNHVNVWTGDGYQSSSLSGRGVVNVYSYGVSDNSGAKIPFAIDKTNPGASSFIRGVAEHDTSNFTYTDVELVSLDDFADDRGWLTEASGTIFAILKIDVEGLDEKVLAGAEKLVATGRVFNVLMEMSSKSMHDAINLARIFSLGGMKLCFYGHVPGPDKDAGKLSGNAAVEFMESNCFPHKFHCNLWWCK